MTKKGVLGIALLAVSLGTIVVFLVSSFVQPILPSTMNYSVILLIASLVGVLGVLAAFNDVVELFHKLFNGRSIAGQLGLHLGEHSLSIYPHRNPPYNAAKMIYTGSEIVKDLGVKIVYKDSAGNPQTKVVTDFFPKDDPQMIWHYYKYDFLEPNQVAYFHLLKKKTTLDGKATVLVSLVGATSGKFIEIQREFELQDF